MGTRFRVSLYFSVHHICDFQSQMPSIRKYAEVIKPLLVYGRLQKSKCLICDDDFSVSYPSGIMSAETNCVLEPREGGRDGVELMSTSYILLEDCIVLTGEKK